MLRRSWKICRHPVFSALYGSWRCGPIELLPTNVDGSIDIIITSSRGQDPKMSGNCAILSKKESVMTRKRWRGSVVGLHRNVSKFDSPWPKQMNEEGKKEEKKLQIDGRGLPPNGCSRGRVWHRNDRTRRNAPDWANENLRNTRSASVILVVIRIWNIKQRDTEQKKRGN